MKYSLTLISAAALLGAICAQAEDVLPPRFAYERYSKMVDNSPFAIATAVAAPAATPDFAKDLYVAKAARSPDGVPPEMQQLVPPTRELRSPHSRGLIQRNPRGASKGSGSKN